MNDQQPTTRPTTLQLRNLYNREAGIAAIKEHAEGTSDYTVVSRAENAGYAALYDHGHTAGLTEAQTALAAVRALHVAHEEEILPYACMEGDCDHEPITRDIGGCPTVKVQVCTECTNLAWAKDPEWLPGEARFPCATIKALDAAEKA